MSAKYYVSLSNGSIHPAQTNGNHEEASHPNRWAPADTIEQAEEFARQWRAQREAMRRDDAENTAKALGRPVETNAEGDPLVPENFGATQRTNLMPPPAPPVIAALPE